MRLITLIGAVGMALLGLAALIVGLATGDYV